MSVYQDFINFVDGGSIVPYFVDGATYYPKPVSYIEKFEYDFKVFYHTSHGCYLGIHCKEFVRKISVREFNLVKSKLNSESVVSRVQKVFDF